MNLLWIPQGTWSMLVKVSYFWHFLWFEEPARCAAAIKVQGVITQREGQVNSAILNWMSTKHSCQVQFELKTPGPLDFDTKINTCTCNRVTVMTQDFYLMMNETVLTNDHKSDYLQYASMHDEVLLW